MFVTSQNRGKKSIYAQHIQDAAILAELEAIAINLQDAY
jgi:hypothetical protein